MTGIQDAIATLRYPTVPQGAREAAADRVEAEIARLEQSAAAYEDAMRYADEHLARAEAAEAEVARLEQEREKFRQIASDEMSLTEQQRARAEAAEAEVARLKDGLRLDDTTLARIVNEVTSRWQDDGRQGVRGTLVDRGGLYAAIRALLAEDAAASSDVDDIPDPREPMHGWAD